MPALVAGIHDLLLGGNKKDVDGRDKPGHDGEEGSPTMGLTRSDRVYLIALMRSMAPFGQSLLYLSR